MAEQQSQQEWPWPIAVTKRLEGVDFPMDRKTAEQKLSGVSVEGKDIGQLFDRMNFPVNSPADLEQQIKTAKEGGSVSGRREMPTEKGGQHSHSGGRD